MPGKQHSEEPAPARKRLVRWLPLILFAAGLAYILPLSMYAIELYDEGIVACGAQRVLNGEVPYRDFWTLYPPGQFYLVAAEMKVFGVNLGVVRVFGALEASAIAMFVFLLAKRVCSWKLALIPWLLAVIWMPTAHLFTATIPAALCVFAAVYFAIRHVEKPAHYKVILSGVFCGLAGVFRQDTFIYAFAVSVIAFVMARYFPSKAWKVRQSLSKRSGLMKNMGLFAAGLAVAGGIPAILLLSAAPFSVVWQNLMVFPLTVFPNVRGRPYPRLHYKVKWLTHYLPFIFLGVAILVYALRSDRRERVSLKIFLPLATLVVLFAFQQSVRPGWPHLTGSMMTALVLSGFVIESFWPAPRTTVGRMAVFVFSLLFVLYVGYGWVSYRAKHLRGNWTYSNLERVGAIKVPVEPIKPIEEVVKYLQEHTSEGTPLFVGCPRYDVIYINDILLYFLADRPCACRYNELSPGVIQTAEVQREIIGDLERVCPPYVVIWSGAQHIREPNQSSVSSGVFDLQHYVQEHYSPEVKFGFYEILARKP